jgi:hypothetical protein
MGQDFVVLVLLVYVPLPLLLFDFLSVDVALSFLPTFIFLEPTKKH